jgi:hypothetical protein
MSRVPIVFVTGKDPLEEPGGGHSSYMRAHARAALAAGFEPHLFAVGRGRRTIETDYGVIHRLPSPLMWMNRFPHHAVSNWMAPFHEKLLAEAVVAFMRARPA